jgi:hypothetical protein
MTPLIRIGLFSPIGYRLVIPLLFFLSNVQAKDYNILDFGAKNGEKATSAIQEAVDHCHAHGGGRVLVPAGKFITGTIVLKSHVILHLEPGAVLQASHDITDYLRTFRLHGMIFAEDATDIGITGTGTINAQGTTFYDPTGNHTYEEFDRQLTRQKEKYMPEGEFYTDGPIKRLPKPGMTISFFHCSNILMRDFLLLDTPSWAIRLGYCEEGHIDGIKIFNNLMVPNSDGIHMTASRNMRITNCHISAGDDAIIVTGFAIEENVPDFDPKVQEAHEHGNKSIYAENIMVTNSQLQSRSSAIRIGYGQHPIRRCIFSNIQIYGSNRGIGVFAHDKSHIEDLIFSNITIETRLHNGQWWGNGEPIHLSAVSRFEDIPAGSIKNVQFRNIIMEGEHGIVAFGLPSSPLENISFKDVVLHIKKGKETMDYGGNFDFRPVADPGLRLFQHDIPGLYAQYTNGLTLDDFRLSWDEDLPAFFTHGVWCKSVSNLILDKTDAPANPNSSTSQTVYLEGSSFKPE